MSNAILYACIAKKSNIHVEHSIRSGNFFTIVYKILGSLGQNDQKMTYTFDKHYFNIKIYDGITYLCITSDEMGRKIPYSFLDEICNLFDPIKNKMSTVSKFNNTLESKMKEYSNIKFEFSKVKEIQKEVNDVKIIMTENIENLMKRGDELKELEDKTESIEFEANKLKIGAETVKTKMQQYGIIKIILIIACVCGVLLVGGLVIWNLACDGINIECRRTTVPPINVTVTSHIAT